MTETLPPPIALYRLGTAFYVSQALFVAAKLGLADHLADEPRSAEDLARRAGCHADALRRVLRLLVSAGVFREDDEGRFSATELGACMREGSSRSSVLLFSGPGQWAVWGDLLTTVKTGEPALERVFGVGPFQYFDERPEEAAVFDRAMSGFSAMIAKAVAAAYDFSSMRSVVDVGGGDGALLLGILEAQEALRGTVFDLPRLAGPARRRIADAGLGERCAFLGGDFFTSVPPGADAYVLKHVIHDWEDARAADILRNVRRAMGEGGKLLIVESLYPERIDTSSASQGAAKNDCNMLVATGGRQRTEQAFRDLLAAAGLRLSRVVPTPMTSILEAEPT
ncbi:MAG: methyltransferase [Sandaracinaceae bacterium]